MTIKLSKTKEMLTNMKNIIISLNIISIDSTSWQAEESNFFFEFFEFEDSEILLGTIGGKELILPIACCPVLMLPSMFLLLL